MTDNLWLVNPVLNLVNMKFEFVSNGESQTLRGQRLISSVSGTQYENSMKVLNILDFRAPWNLLTQTADCG